MSQIKGSSTPRWFSYFITLLLGFAFFTTLLQLAWNTVLDKKEKEYSLEAVSIKEAVARNVLAGNDVVNNVAAYINSNPDTTQDEFNTFTDDILKRYSHIESINYYSHEKNNGYDTFILTYQISRKQDYFSIGENIYHLPKYRDAIDTAALTRGVVPAPPDIENDPERKYWLFKVLNPENIFFAKKTGFVNETINGAVSVFVSPEKLLGDSGSKSRLSITMFSNTENLSGRQLLYFNKMDTVHDDRFWKIDTLSEENIIQLPPYSIKLIISKDIYFSDLDYHIIFIAALLGAGILLLLFALARAKELQANELINRNKLIEKKVDEQTRELAIARDEALEASRIKSEFLASMSHEIRTPLNAIIGMAELLSETKLSDEQKKYIGVFRKAGDTLLSLVSDILDLSKIEAKQMVLEEIPFDLVSLIDETVEIYALKAAEKNIDLVCRITPELNRYRIGDPSRLRQIILNLISNALKFTDEGEIVVNVQPDENVSAGNRIKISVADTGIGIPQDKLDSIFASFTQADSSTTRKYGGTGLGLTISKSLVEHMDGKIWVESEENKGSTFSLVILLKRQEKTQEIEKTLTDKTVLIIDEHTGNSSVIADLLESKGAIAKKMNNREALLYFDSESTVLSDLVFMDSMLAFQEDSDLLDKVLSNYKKSQVVLMINPARLNQHIEAAKQYSLKYQLVKPIKRDELITKAEKLLTKKHTDKEMTEEKQRGQNEKNIVDKHILLVEDNPDNRLLIKAYLKSTPYTLDEAENGQIAVELFKNGQYDLVLMDVQMPVMDGHEATRTMRKWEEENGKQRTIIISLTAHAIKEEIDKCIAAGCDSHLSKPIKKATLIQTIEELS